MVVRKARKLLNEQAEFANEQAQVLRDAPGTLARRAAAKTARTVKALERPARVATRAGVQLTSLSQHTLESLLELQLEVVTSDRDPDPDGSGHRHGGEGRLRGCGPTGRGSTGASAEAAEGREARVAQGEGETCRQEEGARTVIGPTDAHRRMLSAGSR